MLVDLLRERWWTRIRSGKAGELGSAQGKLDPGGSADHMPCDQTNEMYLPTISFGTSRAQLEVWLSPLLYLYRLIRCPE